MTYGVQKLRALENFPFNTQTLVIPFSGHVVSLAINRRLQVADAVAWSSAFVGQRNFNDRNDLEEGSG
jgi:aspartate ammonia-lyase